MVHKKNTGSYYTPQPLANFIVEHLSEMLSTRDSISILEPSVGDGIFLKALDSNAFFANRNCQTVAIEKNKRAFTRIYTTYKESSVSILHQDFLLFSDEGIKIDLVIGNPPYVKKNRLAQTQIKLGLSIHKGAGISEASFKNIWSAFLVKCIGLLNTNGILAFVLPAEFLQVKFASELRQLVESSFDRVEIFTFSELLFEECKGQDTILLIAQKSSEEKGVFVSNIESLANIDSKEVKMEKKTVVKDSKWSHFNLDSEELQLLEKLRTSTKLVSEYCNSKAGIVTAANGFFIVDDEKVKEYSLQSYIKPIIQRGLFVNGSVVVDCNDFDELVESGKPTNLLALNENSVIRKNQKINAYLKLGKQQGLHDRYKMTMREKWYEVPNVAAAPQAFFFKRCDEYPKLIKNTAKVLATDSAYYVDMKSGFNVNSLIYSFYNSFTLSLAELGGRYYGGGVLELTPNEFKGLHIPYVPITADKFKKFRQSFENKSSIQDICDLNDLAILKSVDEKIDSDTIKKLSAIRKKLLGRRIKSNR